MNEDNLVSLEEAVKRQDRKTDDALIQTSAEFVAGFTAPDYIVDGILQRRYLYSLTARTGDGKTAVLLYLAAMVATGEDFNEAQTSVGRVCYLAGENPDDVRARWLLMADVFKFDADSIDVHFIPGIFSIPSMFDRIRDEAEDVGGFNMVIIDTSAAYFQGHDENSNTELKVHAQDMRVLTTLPGGPAVIVACHPTKNPGKENLLPRGGGSFTAEVDGNLTLWSEDKTTSELHWAGKIRGPNFEPMSFKMEGRTCERVKDSKGRVMPSVVALPVSDTDAQEQLEQTIRVEDSVLVAMRNDPSISMAQIALDMGWISTKTNQPLKSKVERAVHELKADGLARKARKKWVLTKTGKSEADEIMRKDEQGLLG
jgi:hypothetical protein